MACELPSLVHCRLLSSASVLHPLWASSLLFLPALAALCRIVQVPLTAAGSVTVTAALEQLLPVSAAMLPILLPQRLSALLGSLVTTLVATPLLLLPPPLVFTVTLYYVKQTRNDQREQLFTGSTVASQDMATQDHVPG